MAIGDRGAYSSKDGLTWEKLPNKPNLVLICHGNQRFVGSRGHSLYYSSDGVDWKLAETKSKIQINKIIYVEGRAEAP